MLSDKADIDSFEKYLEKGRNKHTAAQRFSHAKEYAHVLQTGDAHELLTLPDGKRLHVMKSLAVLAKFYGIRDEWRRIKDNHGLKWTYDNNDHRTFQAITDSKNYGTMIKELRDVRAKLPKTYVNVLLYCTLTGLRPVKRLQASSWSKRT